jgi:hypothetical protein
MMHDKVQWQVYKLLVLRLSDAIRDRKRYYLHYISFSSSALRYGAS